MADEQEPGARLEGEPSLWYSRFVSYLQMGPARSLLGAVKAEEAQKSPKKPNNQVPGAWKEAAASWRWKERAEAWDEFRRKQVFTMGNAYDVVRIEKLDSITQRLEVHITRMLDNLESPEYLEKAKGKPWFNAFLLERYYQGLEALAAETGGRVKKQDINLSFSEEQEQAEQELNQILSQFVRGETDE